MDIVLFFVGVSVYLGVQAYLFRRWEQHEIRRGIWPRKWYGGK